MLSAVLLMTGLGCLCGLGLAIASKVFYVYEDPRLEELVRALPGANCGGCGFAGCGGAAEAILTKKAAVNICVAGGTEVHEEVAQLMGVEFSSLEPSIAHVGCFYGLEESDRKYHYNGVKDCKAAMMLYQGPKSCSIGCLGLGTCVKACPFNALSFGADGLPAVDKKRCTGCGTCERECPKNIIRLASDSELLQKEYTTDMCSSPCQRTCPAGIDVAESIYQLSQKNYSESLRVIKDKNPFPVVCSRICYRPCEFACRRNLIDEPVGINYLKRFVADCEMNSGRHIAMKKAPATDRKVAVIGGGAEGLTAAYFLARFGHAPTVLDAMPELGGLLRTVINRLRLPIEDLDWDIQGILETGVHAIVGQRLGEDFTIASLLKEGHDAVLIATGGWDTQLAVGLVDKPVEVLPGVQLLPHFTLRWLRGQAPTVGKQILILGGGSTSMDAAQICMEMGAEKVHILFRNNREDSPFTTEAIESASSEGIQFHFNSALIKMMGQEASLESVQIARFQTSGSKGGIEDMSEIVFEELKIDHLLIGAGRFPELIYTRQDAADETGEEETLSDSIPWETLVPYSSPFTEKDIGIFRPGEVTSDYKAVVEAIGSGRRAATSIHQYLDGRTIQAPEKMIRRTTRVLDVQAVFGLEQSSRTPMPEKTPVEYPENLAAEIELGYSEEQALKEAGRCLRCGLICYQRNWKNLEQKDVA